MLNRAFIFASLVALASAPGRAENGTVAALVNMAEGGSFCGFVRAEEVRGAGFDCPERERGRPYMALKPAPEILRAAIYQDSARLEVARNECVRQQIEAIDRPDQKYWRQWLSSAVISWLGLRKAQLIRHACESLYYVHLEPVDVKRKGLEPAFRDWLKRRPPLQRALADPREDEARAKLDKICLDERARAALASAETLYQSTVPVYSSNEMYETLDRFRNGIVDKATGRPLTDEALGTLDLHRLENLDVRLDAEAKRRLRSSLIEAVDRRASLRPGLEAAARGEEPSANIRDFLFEDGALWQSLNNHGLITTDILRRPLEVSASAKCVLSWHESSIVGGLAEFGADAAVWGIAFASSGWVVKTAEDLAKLTRFQRAKKIMGAGALGVVGSDVANAFVRSCLSNERRAMRTVDQSRGEPAAAYAGKKQLPSDIAFESQEIEFDKGDAPACDDVASRDLAYSTTQANCLRDTIDNILPPWAQVLSVAIPR